MSKDPYAPTPAQMQASRCLAGAAVVIKAQLDFPLLGRDHSWTLEIPSENTSLLLTQVQGFMWSLRRSRLGVLYG